MSLGQGERERGEPRNAHLSCATRYAVPLVVIEPRPSHFACVSPIRTATGARATAGSELRKRAPRVLGQDVTIQRLWKYGRVGSTRMTYLSFVANLTDRFVLIVPVGAPHTRLRGFALRADQRDALRRNESSRVSFTRR